MDVFEDRTVSIGFKLKPSERIALEQHAQKAGFPTIAAAIREAVNQSSREKIFKEPAREGRKPGFSPKRKAG
jgi:hypothetical protein